jgi:hypothetical protein
LHPIANVRSWLPEVALILAGLLVREALYFPITAFPLDADGVLAGLCAFGIQTGHYPAFFPGGTRLSSASCYVAAGYFHVFGDGRLGLALTGLTWSALYLVFTMLFLRVVFDRKTAWFAFLFALIPAEQFVTIAYVPWGYGEIMASGMATLWLAARCRVDRAGSRPFWFGVSVGFGLWISLQTLMIALPAVVWIVMKRRREAFAQAPRALAGVVLGLIPFWVGNAANGFASLTHNWASRPATNLAHVWNDFVWLLSSPLPGLLFHGYSGWWSASTVLIFGYALTAAGFGLALAHRRDANATDRLQAAPLVWLVATACVLLFSFSEAGSLRGWTVRYIAPLYLIVPVFGAIGIAGLWRKSRWLAAAAAAALLLPNFVLYSFPGTRARDDMAIRLQTVRQLDGILRARHVALVYGDYFSVYDINFDSRERLLGIPAYGPADYFDFARRLRGQRVGWAMFGEARDLRQWAGEAGARGTLTQLGDGWLFIADRPANDAGALVAALRSRCTIGSCAAPFPR